MRTSLAITLLLGTWAAAAPTPAYFGYDVNGDGIPDVGVSTGGYYGYGLNGVGLANGLGLANGGYRYGGVGVDVNGDGVADMSLNGGLYGYGGALGSGYYRGGYGLGGGAYGIGLGTSGPGVAYGVDVNGDGVTDIGFGSTLGYGARYGLPMGVQGGSEVISGAEVIPQVSAVASTSLPAVPDVVNPPMIEGGSVLNNAGVLGVIDNTVNMAYAPEAVATVRQYTNAPIQGYYGVDGILPQLPGASFVSGAAQVDVGLPNVPVPMPQTAIPIPETTDLTAILPTSVASVPGSIPFPALESNAVGGAIYGLGTPVADTVGRVVNYAGIPTVNGVPAMPDVPDMGGAVPILTDDQIASLLVNHGVNSERVSNMVAQLASFLSTSAANSYIAISNGMNSVLNSGAENWQNIANIRSSLGSLVAGIQRDQSTAVKEGLATILTAAGESQEKTNLLAEKLSNMFVNTALNQQALVNAGVNQMVKTNIGNMDNANTIIAQLTEAFTSNQNLDTPIVNENLMQLINAVAARSPLPTGGAVLDNGVPIGPYVQGASAAAVGNQALDALAASANGVAATGYGLDVNGDGIADVGLAGGLAGGLVNGVAVGNGLGLGLANGVVANGLVNGLGYTNGLGYGYSGLGLDVNGDGIADMSLNGGIAGYGLPGLARTVSVM